jgi:hypothetical protein
MRRAAERGVDWWVHRIAASESYQTDPHTVRHVWYYRDQLEAHKALDALDEVRALHRPDPPKRRGA